MTDKTPGRIAYETFHAARWPHGPGVAWTHPANAKSRPCWETSAAAVQAPVIAERDRYRDELTGLQHRLATLAGELSVQARITAPSKKSEIQADATAGTEHLAAELAEGGRG